MTIRPNKVGCKILGCDRKHHLRGFCIRHYEWARTSRVDENGVILIPVRQMGGRICKVNNCNAKYHSSGFCEKHRAQFRRGIIDSNGNILRQLKCGKALEKCKIDGCNGPDDGRGFCSRHNYWRRMGIIDTDGNKLKPLYYEKIFDKRTQHKKSEEFVMNRYFNGGPLCRCSVCGGEYEFYQMDGHHPDRSKKTMTPTVMMSRLIKKHPKMIKEMDSLKWMCCHCHLVIEAGGDDVFYAKTNAYKVGRAMDKVMDIILARKGRECVDCHRVLGRRTVVFHHRNPLQKIAVVSQIIGRRKIDFVLAEADKCDLLCAPCHRKRHHQDRSLRGKNQPWSIKRGRVGCGVFGCKKKYFARGFCSLHVQQFYRGIIDNKGNPLRELHAKVA